MSELSDFYVPDTPEDFILEIELGERAAWALGVWNDYRNPRVCALCDRAVWPEEPDPCLGWLPGVVFACCGHGSREGFPQGMVTFTNGLTIRFDHCLVDDVHFVRDVEDGVRVMRRVGATA